MEGHLHGSPKLGNSIDSDDAKYVSGLSTILVATIQEAKDRISQIEYIFCSQLFPNFQLKSKSLQKIFTEAKKAAEDAQIEKEKDLKLQIERLQLERQRALEENHTLKLEMEMPSKEQEEKTNELLAKIRNQQLRIDELVRKLKEKSGEVDEGMELQNKLIQMVQSKDTTILNMKKQLNEYEEKTNELPAKVNSLEEKIDKLQEELGRKNVSVAEGKLLQENLFKKIESLASEIVANEHKLIDNEKEKKFLHDKLVHTEDIASELQKELRRKSSEVEERRKLQNHLAQQIDLCNIEMSKNKQLLVECEKEKKLLVADVVGLQSKINDVQVNPGGMRKEESDSYEKLLQQLDIKTSEVLAEKKKRRDVIEAYKKLKSQYNFLCSKFGLTSDNMLPQSSSFTHNKDSMTSPDLVNGIPVTSAAFCDTKKVKHESGCLEEQKGDELVQKSSFGSPTNFPVASKCPSDTTSAPVSGAKRPASCWRETKTHQCQGGPDPHDDFLDTPFENIIGNLNKDSKELVRDLPVTIQKDKNCEGSDDETQDMNVNRSPEKQQMPFITASKKGFKYVEPVRKKSDREKLKGVECKQCKKFYDAVLPNDGGRDANGNQRNFRCEHHDGVSRHRYRYPPPLTPEGFWNIGFESEMS